MSGSRLDDESACLRCGGIIINLNPRLKMCSACEKEVTTISNIRINNRKSSNTKKVRIRVGSLSGIRPGSKR